jgi:hypothetical protein
MSQQAGTQPGNNDTDHDDTDKIRYAEAACAYKVMQAKCRDEEGGRYFAPVSDDLNQVNFITQVTRPLAFKRAVDRADIPDEIACVAEEENSGVNHPDGDGTGRLWMMC